MIAIIGPTATGKTTLAAHFASRNNGEVISADSRQVYKGMDIGTGKDISEYEANGRQVPYHLIDIVWPGEEYNVYRYQKDFLEAYHKITERGRLPVLCGGTGMYIDAVLKGYHLLEVPENKALRKELENKDKPWLIKMLKSYKTPHNTTDTEKRHRLIRAIEIQDFYSKNEKQVNDFPRIDTTIFGIHFDRETLRERITNRLQERLENGMIEETERLLSQGISPETLKFYGLEYRYLTHFLKKELTYREMFSGLNTSIHQFAKRQITWFRRMEKQGTRIRWIDGKLPLKDKIREIENYLSVSHSNENL